MRWRDVIARTALITFRRNIVYRVIVLPQDQRSGTERRLQTHAINGRVNSGETRKPCYRKDDRAMRPIYGCPEKFRESSQTPPATVPEICNGLLFRSILRMCIQNLKFVALSVPEIIGGTQKIWAVPRYAHAPFSLKFLKGFCSDGPCEYTCQI